MGGNKSVVAVMLDHLDVKLDEVADRVGKKVTC